jgi:peptidoglycan/LPS O-acetylase OafA/YrhL
MRKHFYSLDLLRGGAAISVAISHFFMSDSVAHNSFETLSIISVEIFFVLSGFVLAPQLIQCANSASRIGDFRIFLYRRWLRTVPAYVVALLAATLVISNSSLQDFLFYLTYTQNLTAIHITQDYFPIAWSLSIEEWFYLLFPPALIGFYGLLVKFEKLDSQKALMISAALFALVIIIVRTFILGNSGNDFDARRIVLFRLDAISYGFLLFMYLSGGLKANRWFFLATGITSVGIVFYIVGSTGHLSPIMSSQLFSFAAAGIGASLIVLMLSLESYIYSKPVMQICEYFGRTSYSIYLFHTLIIIVLTKAEVRLGFTALAFVAVCYGFSSVFYLYFEKPILEARPTYKRSAQMLEQSVIKGRDIAGTR